MATYGYPALLNIDNEEFSSVPFWSIGTIPSIDLEYKADYFTSSRSGYDSTWTSGEPAGYEGIDLIATSGMSGGPIVSGFDGDQKIVSVYVSGNDHEERAKLSVINGGIQDIPSNFMSWYAHIKDKTLQVLNRRVR